MSFSDYINLKPAQPFGDREALYYVKSAVEAGLWPWSPGEITLYRNDAFGREGDSIVIETSLLPKLPFCGYLDYNKALRGDLAGAISEYADEAFRWYRYRRTPSIDDHIILGED